MTHAVSDAADAGRQIGEIVSALGVELAASQIRCLVEFVALLRQWNAVYNLTAVRDLDRIATHHIADCLAVVGPLQRQVGRSTSIRLLDVGSGGGFPGLIIAMAFPDWSVDCLDAVGKKAAFLTHAAASLNLKNLVGAHARVEAWKSRSYDVVCSRAFAPLSVLTAGTKHLVDDDSIWLAMKGKVPVLEISELPPEVDVFHVEQLTVPRLDEERCLVWMHRAP